MRFRLVPGAPEPLVGGGTGEEDLFGAVEVLLGVDADGVMGGGDDVDGDIVLEKAELLEALGPLEG